MMQKKSSYSSRNDKFAGKNALKRNDGQKPFKKDAKPFKNNYNKFSPDGEKTDRLRANSELPQETSGYSKSKPAGKGKKTFDKPFDRNNKSRRADFPTAASANSKPAWAEKKSSGRSAGDDKNPRQGFKKERKAFPGNEDGRRNFDKPHKRESRPGNLRDEKKYHKDSGGVNDRKEDTRPFRKRHDPFMDKPERPKKEPDVISFSKDIDDNRREEKEFKPKRLKIQKLEAAKKAPLTNKGRKKNYHNEDDEDDAGVGERTEMPLNKYIAHSGECSRRDAADMVKQGKVKVNGELVLDPGYRVKQEDQVTLSGKKLIPVKSFVYILLNKPKGFITTNDDPQGRKTVMELVANSGEERLFPVGRLDRDTTGLLLMTNDGALTQKLCHPSYDIKKVYHVTLDKPLTKADFEKIVAGVELEDGKAIVDEIAYLEAKNELGLEIHSGRNRIVRRIFESLGYVVEKLDRVMYAGLTKKNLPRSKWRYLNEREIVLLKHFKS